MADIVNLNGYKIKDEKAVRSYDTIALMKADTKLKEGYYVKTKGYHEANDGGGGEYIINSSPDDFSEELDNGLYANLIIENNVLKLKQLGLKNTDEDISSKLQIAINNSYNAFSILIDDIYNIKNTITINRPVIIKGNISNYDNWGNCGFNCIGDKTFFILDEGCINSTFEQLMFKGSKSYSEGYEGTCIRFSSRDDTITDYRVWKNLFFKCHFTHFALVFDFYAEDNIADWDYSSEILFLHCKLLNNTTNCLFKNKQSYNINFISTDFETWYQSTGCIFNTLSGVNFYGCSIILNGDFIKTERNENLNPASNFGGTINVTNCRFEIKSSTENVFNFFMTGGTYPGVSGDNHANLNVTDSEFYIHDTGNGATLLSTNLQGLHCSMKGISFTGVETNKLKLNIEGSSGIAEYSRIIIDTPNAKKLELANNTTAPNLKPWVIINGNILLSCVSGGHANNVYEYNDKIYLGYADGYMPYSAFQVFVPWNYKKLKINVSGAFMGNNGTITITNSDNTFTDTFTKSDNNLSSTTGEILLPYKSTGDTYTITASNIWGNCYFEK